MKPRIIFHVVAAALLAAVVVAAQSPKAQTKPTQAPAPQNRQFSMPSISERETGTGMASGRRQHEPVTITAREAGSGMATGRTMTGQESESGQPSYKESGVTAPRETGSGMATGRKSGSVIVLDRESVTTARETGSGMATGRRSGSIVVTGSDDDRKGAGASVGKPTLGDPHEYANARNSAHATESLDARSKHAGNMSQAQSNPMYKDSGTQGTNPLYEPKDKKTSAPPSSGNGAQPVEYKDGEDGVSHTRPGNHKPGKMN